MLTIRNLTVELKSRKQQFHILRDVSFTVNQGEIVGLAGESGSGKSVLARTIMGLNQHPVVKTAGSIVLDGAELTTDADFRGIRGRKISMIFQNPTGSLNPVFTIGQQLEETIRLTDRTLSAQQIRERSIQLLTEVEIPHPAERLNSYPHQLSGGMNQRVMIALALATSPELLIADEPTTALDVTIQAQIIKLLQKLNRERNLTILFITHDLSLLEHITGRAVILYAGEVMEVLPSADLRGGNVHHPYTVSLKRCIPEIDGDTTTLFTIPGQIALNTGAFESSCIFSPRCYKVQEACTRQKPAMTASGVRCFYPEQA